MMNSFNSFYKNINNRKYNTWCKYQKRIDTYGCGCAHDCKYCYAKALLNFRKSWNVDNPKVAYITEIEKTISLLSKIDVIRMGSMTDCFQPIEKVEKVTYETIKILNQYSINYLIVTKSSIVSNNEYLNIYNGDLAHFQISISSTNNEQCKKYENACPITERIKSAEKLYELGFDVSIRLSPAIYQFIDFRILNHIKCEKILIEFLKVNHFIKKSFDIDYSEYSLKYGGHHNLQLDKKIEIVNNIQGFPKISIGEYVKEHHEYFSKNVNHNKNDCCNLNLLFGNNAIEGTQTELAL